MRHNHKLFLDFCTTVAGQSSATRLKTGAVIAKDAQILSFGYNGTPSGWETNACEIKGENDILITNEDIVIHAEMNAILKAAKTGHALEGAHLYVTHSPCAKCAKHILQTGIKHVHYIDSYRLSEGLNILKKGGVNVICYKEHEGEQDSSQEQFKSSTLNSIAFWF